MKVSLSLAQGQSCMNHESFHARINAHLLIRRGKQRNGSNQLQPNFFLKKLTFIISFINSEKLKLIKKLYYSLSF